MVILCPGDSCRCDGTGFSLMNTVYMNQIKNPRSGISRNVRQSEVASCFLLFRSTTSGRVVVSSGVGSLFHVLLFDFLWVDTGSTGVTSVSEDK